LNLVDETVNCTYTDTLDTTCKPSYEEVIQKPRGSNFIIAFFFYAYTIFHFLSFLSPPFYSCLNCDILGFVFNR